MQNVELAQNSGEIDFIKLGVDHACGHNAALDLVAAHMWFNIAAMRGNRDAARRRAELAEEMTAAEIAEAQKRARETLAKLH